MGPLLDAIDWRSIALLVAAAVGFGVWGFVRGWWVMGKRYDEVVVDRDYWRDKFFDAIGLAEASTRIAKEEVGR